MGNRSSTEHTHGALQGAYPPAICTSVSAPSVPEKSYLVTIPTGLSSGDVFHATLAGTKFVLNVPQGKKAGETMMVVKPDTTKVYASTLSSLPGMVIVQAKPIVFGSVSHSFTTTSRGTFGQQNMGQQVGRLMQAAQQELLEQTARSGCNAVLAIHFNVTNDSSGEYGNIKSVIVTACGTPCTIMPQSSKDIPVVEATAIVEPLYLG